MAKGRGRPVGLMTHRRTQVYEEMVRIASEGGEVRLARLARSCGLYDYRNVRRIVADLRRLGKLSG